MSSLTSQPSAKQLAGDLAGKLVELDVHQGPGQLGPVAVGNQVEQFGLKYGKY
jgi:hypothetical protein